MRRTRHIDRIQTDSGPLGAVVTVVVGLGALFLLAYYIDKYIPTEQEVLSGECVELLTIEDVESQYNIEVLMPTGRELQKWCLRRGGDIGPRGTDGVIGPNTVNAMDWVRCQQEASRHYPVFEDPDIIIDKEFWR